MSLRWSPLLTLLLVLPGMALAQAHPEGDAAPGTGTAQAPPVEPDDAAALEAGAERISEPPLGLEAGPERSRSTPEGAPAPEDAAALEADAAQLSDAERNAEAQARAPDEPVPVAEALESLDAEVPQLHRVELIDGQSLIGVLRSRDAHGVMLEIGDGPRIYLSRSTIAKVSPEAPAADRPLRPQTYFLAPSALLLKEGQGSIAQLELLLTEFSYGITDNLNFSIGSILPFWFADGGSGFNILATVKAGGSVNEILHLAAGAYGIFVPAALNTSVAVLGVGYGSVTVGTMERNVTLSLGIPVAAANPIEGVLVNLSGTLRVSQIVALTSELWSIPGGSGAPNTWLWGGGTRLDLRPFSVDVGVFILGQGGSVVPVPLPWLAASYNFG